MAAPAVAVIGGGVSGLACAHRLTELSRAHKKELSVTVLEASSRFGGIVRTEKKDGFLLEYGPDSFLREKPWALELAKRLGLEDQLIGTRDDARRSLVARGRKLVPVPEGFYLIAPLKTRPFLTSSLFSPLGKLRMLAEPFIPARGDDADESIASFVRRRFGNECLERAGQPMLGGIYTGDPEELSILSTLPRFRALEKQHGSLTLGLKKEKTAKEASGPRYGLFASFKGGMQTLTDALEKALEPSSLRRDAAVHTLSYDSGKKKWKILLEEGDVLEVDAVCSTLPPHRARQIFQENFKELSSELSGIRQESVVTANFAFRAGQVRRRVMGAGFVVPRTEKRTLIACTFADRKFEGRAPAGFRLFRGFAGGAFGRQNMGLDNEWLLTAMEEDLRQLLGIREKPLFASINRHPASMVQYGVGHLERAGALERRLEAIPGLFLAGTGLYGVGIPDCVREAEKQAENILKFVIPA